MDEPVGLAIDRSRAATPRRLLRGCQSTGRDGGLALAGQGLLGALPDDSDDPPPLELRERAGLHDLDEVSQVRLVGLVVRVADGAAAEELAVLRVREEGLDLDPAGLVHLVGRHDPDLRLATA